MMNVFKRKSVYAAVLAGLGAVGVAGSANAVHINPDGLGQVLIYPYYTVRAGNDTYISVVNTSAVSAKAVKVRFLEGKNSKEVLDFNLYLSPNDVWTGAVVATADGAKLITADKSCTAPAIPAGGQPFVEYAYSGDGEDQTLNRTREGYFEMIEMGDVANATYAGYIKHSNGTPANCAALQNVTMVNGADVTAPPAGGELVGSASLLAPALGTDYGYDAVALDDWTIVPVWTAPDSTAPDIGGGSVTSSNVFTKGTIATANWTVNRDAVSAVMMHDKIINEFMLDSATASGTDWVITMPTKRLYVNGTTALNPFLDTFGTGGSCDPITMLMYDREEGVSTGVKFSPLPAGQVSSLCWEANVVTFNNSNVLGSINETNISTNYTNGWLSMKLDQSATVNVLTSIDAVPVSYYGLPAVGFAVQDYTNGNAAPGVMATYGGNFNHKFTRNIQ